MVNITLPGVLQNFSMPIKADNPMSDFYKFCALFRIETSIANANNTSLLGLQTVFKLILYPQKEYKKVALKILWKWSSVPRSANQDMAFILESFLRV